MQNDSVHAGDREKQPRGIRDAPSAAPDVSPAPLHPRPVNSGTISKPSLIFPMARSRPSSTCHPWLDTAESLAFNQTAERIQAKKSEVGKDREGREGP